jgi:transposase
MFECHQHTVRKTIRRWEERGLGGLWEAPGRGAKPRLQAEDLQYVKELLAQETRTYNSGQLVKKLKQERGVDLSSDSLRRLLKKNSIDGNEPALVIGKNKMQFKEQSSKQT